MNDVDANKLNKSKDKRIQNGCQINDTVYKSFDAIERE